MSGDMITRKVTIREYSSGEKFYYKVKIHELDGVGGVISFTASSIEDMTKQLEEELK